MYSLSRDSFYPPHLSVGNLHSHVRRGVETIGRHVVCMVCNVSSNARSRNGDARFILAHKRCGLLK